MINLRYHIVSITAVFLALGIGLAFGAAFIDRATVGTLDANLRDIEEQNRSLEATNDRLEESVQLEEAVEEQFGTEAVPQVVEGRLTDVPVVVVAVRGIDEEPVEVLADAVVAAGAAYGGTLWLTDRLVLDDEGERADLAGVLGREATTDADGLRTQLAGRLSAVLAGAASEPVVEDTDTDTDGEAGDATATGEGPDPTAPVDPEAPPSTPDDPATPTSDPTAPETAGPVGGPGEEPTTLTSVPDEAADPVPVPTLLQGLLDAGFVDLDAPEVAPGGFALLPADGARYLFVSGEGAALGDEELFLPVARQVSSGSAAGQPGGPVVVVGQGGPVAGADVGDDVDPSAERVRVVGPLRTQEAVRGRLSTVDDLERAVGTVAAVWALDLGIDGVYGHYGIGEGAQSLLPGPRPVAPGASGASG